MGLGIPSAGLRLCSARRTKATGCFDITVPDSASKHALCLASIRCGVILYDAPPPIYKKLERVMGLEPTTTTLATLCSTN